MSGRLVAGGTMLVMVLGILWLRAQHAVAVPPVLSRRDARECG